MQQSMLTDSRIQTKVIARKADFDELMSGFARLRAVTYVTSAKMLASLFDDFGFEAVEIIVGEDISPLRKEQLSAEGAPLVDRLARLVEEGNLKVLVPKTTIHTKLYILESADRVRVVQTSANLSDTARRATAQTNYAWYFDLARGSTDALLRTVEADYGVHARRCDLFLRDLIELMNEASDNPREEVIQAWLSGTQPTTPTSETADTVSELTAWAMAGGALEEDAVYRVELPEQPAARRNAERNLALLGVESRGRVVQVHRADLLRHVQETTRFPLLSLDRGKSQLHLFVAGRYSRRSALEPEQDRLDRALQNVEDYLATVDLGGDTGQRACEVGDV